MLDKLSGRLKRLEEQLLDLPGNSEAMLLSEFDGFVAGLLVHPESIAPSEWLPVVCGGEDEESGVVFDNIEQVEKLNKVLMDHYNAVSRDLSRGRYGPIFDIDTETGETFWEFWIEGFERVFALRPDSWPQILDGGDEETRHALSALIVLSQILHDTSDLDGEKAATLEDSAPDFIGPCVQVLNDRQIGERFRKSRAKRTLSLRVRHELTQYQ